MLTADHDDIDAHGVRKWTELKGYLKMTFVTANNIAQSHHCVGDLGKT